MANGYSGKWGAISGIGECVLSFNLTESAPKTESATSCSNGDQEVVYGVTALRGTVEVWNKYKMIPLRAARFYQMVFDTGASRITGTFGIDSIGTAVSFKDGAPVSTTYTISSNGTYRIDATGITIPPDQL